jgi:hypothetical protein
MPSGTDFDTTVRLTILGELLAGHTPSVERVAAAVGAERPTVAEAFARLSASRAIVLDPGTGDLLMAAPFAVKPTSFRVRAGGRAYYANCVWDALGVSAMLAGAGRPADIAVETTCADCGAPLALEVRAGKVSATPPDAVAHFAVPAARWWADIVFT